MPIYWSRRDLNLETASQALLVIAHPDDESMFFSPTITALKQQGTTVCLLCLSNGAILSASYTGLCSADCFRRSGCSFEGCVHSMLLGNYGRIGSVRMQELLAACGILGVSFFEPAYMLLLLNSVTGSNVAILRRDCALTIADTVAPHQCSGSSRSSGETLTCHQKEE